MKRHYTIHGREQNQQGISVANGMVPESAPRTLFACSNCVKTKTKCDKKLPCSRCVGRNMTCTLHPTRRSSTNARVFPPDVPTTIIPPHYVPTANRDHGQTPNQLQNCNPTQRAPTISRPANPENNMTSIPRDGNPAPVIGCRRPQFLDSPTSRPIPPELTSMPSPMKQGAHSLPKSRHIAGVHDFNQMIAEDFDPCPRSMVDWGQVQMPVAIGAVSGVVQPELPMYQHMPFDPTAMALVPLKRGGFFFDQIVIKLSSL